MLLRLSARNITRGSFIWRSIPVRYNSTNGTESVAENEVSDVVLRERRRQFNLEMLEMMNDLTKFPEEDFAKLQLRVDADLTENEKQLDEKLAEFLRKYALESKVFDARNTLPNTEPKASKRSVHGFPYLVPSSSGQPYSEQELFVRQMKHASTVGKLGATLEDVYFPHNDIFNPPSVENTSISKLMAAGVHLGQSTSLWRSSTQPYIYGEYKGIHIIDLNVTLSHLKRAAQVVEGVAENGGIILFLGTREGQKRALQKAAERVKGYYVASRWIPGTLTNPTVISSTWERHEVDYNGVPTGRELTLDESVSIIKPDLLVILNPTENRNALLEAMKVRVPTIGIIDTDSEPSLVTYPIPGNDDSLRSVNLIVSILARAGERGRATRLSKVSELQT